MRLRARQQHRYYHRASRSLYMFAEGEEKEVPDEVGRTLLDAHPGKFAFAGAREAEGYGEAGNVEPVVAAVEEAPQDRIMRRRRREPPGRSPDRRPAEEGKS